MSERTQKVEETSSNEERRKAFNPLHSSIFQNISANLLIIVAVVIVIIICVNSMGQMVRGAVAASTNEARLIQEEARLKLAVSGVSSSLSSLGAVAEAHEEYVPEIVSEIQSQEEIIQQQVEVLQGSILVTQVADGQAQLDELKAGLDSFMQGTDSAISSAQSKDIPSFNSTVEKVLAQDMSALNAAFEKVEGSIDMLVGGMEAFLNITKNSATRTAFIGLGIVILLIVLNIFLSVTRISKKIGSIADEVQGIIEDINAGRGDLTKRIQTPVNTELIFVKEGINDFLRTLQGIIKDVKDGTVVLSASSDEMTRQIHHASDNVTNTSAALEELSASMDNVAYTASGITDRLDEVRTAVDDITATAQDGNETASSIKAEASAIKEEASVKKNHTGARMQELSTVLEQSVRDSEKVRQINDLTNVILEIAAQTNLLSLNASIEAARAGEAGRGFAVVAGEISALAANSRETASKIQAISDDVTQAVNVLSANAQQVLDFINTTVIADYDAFVETGEKYENTSAMIDGMVDQFVEKADHLRAIMVDMTQAVSAITESVEESSKAISMSASNSTEIVSEFSIIDDAMDKNNEVAAQLNTSAQKFEVV